MRFSPRFMLYFGLAACAALPAAAQPPIVIGAPASISAPTYPLTSGGEYVGEYEQIYSAAVFTGTSSAPVTLYGVAFSSARGGTAEAPTYNLSIYASNTGVTTVYSNANGAEDNFAANYGSNRVLVFSGSVTPTLLANNTFDFVIPFTQPFLYNPALSGKTNLLLDIFVNDDDIGSTSTPFQQTASAQTDSIFYADGNFDGSNNSANVVGQQGGLYSKFLLAPVPEPSSIAGMGAGVLGLAALCLRARRRSVRSTWKG